MGWTWHKGLTSATHSSGAGTAGELPTTTSTTVVPAAAKGKAVEAAVPAGAPGGGDKTGVPVSAGPHTEKPGTGVDAV
jgi:hypothetical protein